MDQNLSTQSGLGQSVQDAEALNAAVERANRWLARFAPLVHDLNAPSAQECRKRLSVLSELKGSGPVMLRELERLGGPGEAALAATLRTAVAQMGGLEEDYRRKLAGFAPGDPQGSVDLAALQEDLAAVAARREVEQTTGARIVPAELQMETSPPNLAAAGGLGVFAFGWLSFTTFHAVFMIGGMYHAFGPFALALLGFYAIFFGVGFAMAYGAYQSLMRQSITLSGRRLTVHRSAFGRSWEVTYDLAPDTQARLDESTFAMGNSNVNRQPMRVIVLRGADGRDIRIGRTASRDLQRECVRRLNDYLGAVR